MTTLQTILADIAAIAKSERDKGTSFERLIRQYLKTDPQYADKLEEVWLWEDWPDRPNPDKGIDLVAKEAGSERYWAIQCKFYPADHTIKQADLGDFFTQLGKEFTTATGDHHFAQGVVVASADRWSGQADDDLARQHIPVFRIFLRALEESPVDWSSFDWGHPQDVRLKPKKTPRPDQLDAIEAAAMGFRERDRGKLIMACGTGKTFTSLRLAERLVAPAGRVLFLAPSITLVSQTLREWTAEALDPFHAFVVCSDTKVGREEEDIATHDLAYPATTDAGKLVTALHAVPKDRRTVIFSTYQSIQAVIDAQQVGALPAFDLVICDEAHRTTGITLKEERAQGLDSEFVKVHQNHLLRAAKRLYMTATPRIYNDASKTKAGDKEAVLYSMDDEAIYGPELYRMSFGKAVERGLLSEYKVLIVAVDQDRMAKLANVYNQQRAFKVDDTKAIDIALATKIVGSWKGLSKQGLFVVDDDGNQEALTEDTAPMRRAVAFSKSIKASKTMTEVFADLVSIYKRDDHDGQPLLVDCTLDHVDGGMNAATRKDRLDWLKDPVGDGQCRILSNARCLSEGVDVPALDSVVFFDTRESMVDIVQSVGRVMRRAEGKQYGYIILPVGIPLASVKDYNAYIEGDAQFKGIWKVIKALRAHDERLVDEAEFRRKVRVIGDPAGGREERKPGGGEQGAFDFPPIPIETINEAVYAAIPKKLGDREYWSEWAKSVAAIAEKLIARIEALRGKREGSAAFNAFLKGLRKNINPAIGEDEAVEMLAQHVITRPVFEALFEGYAFSRENPVSAAMQRIIDVLDKHEVDSEVEGLDRFYANVRERVALAKSDKSRQEIVRNLYDTFFNNAFPRMAERLGIVYTPVEVVDFIVRSADAALRKHFGQGIGAEGVQVVDPFTGTGTFMVRLLQSGLIADEDLPRKFAHELHANEIVLLAYYIAAINIESAYHARTGEYRPFDGIVLTDTFQMYEEDQGEIEGGFSKENSQRVERQRRQPIRVVMSNPPYSAQQDSENDNNKNLDYPKLDARIRGTYAAQSGAKLVKNLYDSYIRAIRWASDRIGEQGVVAFVTNGSFVEANNMDGLRKCLAGEYSHLYVFNLRGNQRTAGEESRREGGKIFGAGARTPVAVTIMVKDPAQVGPCELRYHDIGDYLSREDKLAIVEGFGSIDTVPWQALTPNADGDWVNQRNPEFEGFMPLGSKDGGESNVLFGVYSLGVVTNRDPWAFNASRAELEANMRRLIDAFNAERARYATVCDGKPKTQWPELEAIIDADPRRISWTRALKADARRGKEITFDPFSVTESMYRPFAKQWLYFNRRLNEMVYQVPKLFPTQEHHNVVISCTGVADRKGFSVLATDHVPSLHLTDTGQCFPMYWYEPVSDPADGLNLFALGDDDQIEGGYIRRHAITDWAVAAFCRRYGDASISKEDIFWYVYGILHSPEYKTRFAADLKKMLPRIPFAADFMAFSEAGRRLGELHLGYETVEPWPLREIVTSTLEDWRVEKMRYPSKTDKTAIIVNAHLTLADIPPQALDYVVNGKPAVEWVMERYQVTTDKDSGLRNDPNAWAAEHGDPRYIVDLVKRVVRVSMETVDIVRALPALAEATQSEELVPG